jgi:hypothetical protein
VAELSMYSLVNLELEKIIMVYFTGACANCIYQTECPSAEEAKDIICKKKVEIHD